MMDSKAAAQLVIGAAWAREKNLHTGTDYLYCLTRRKLSIRSSQKNFWAGAAAHVMGRTNLEPDGSE